MGGWGSGRRDYATSPTVEECRPLSITNLKSFTERTGGRGSVWWGDREDPAGKITVVAEGDAGFEDSEDLEDTPRPARLRLLYTIRDPRGDDEEEIDYSVPLEYTECNFGGYRPWFRCPGVVDGEHCTERVGKLYRPPRQNLFLCRHCYDLGYTSSRTSGDHLKQAELRYRRAFAKADAKGRRPHPNNEPHFPERAKGEHHDTFEDHCEEVRAARAEWHEAMNAKMRELTARLQDPPL